MEGENHFALHQILEKTIPMNIIDRNFWEFGELFKTEYEINYLW